MAKIIFIIIDGLGDRPIKELGNKTPLEKAKTPNLDYFAKKGITGLMHPLGRGIRPGSDAAHLTIFGYPVEKYYPGRGVFEALGYGLDLKKGDIALRGNLATVNKNKVVIDRRAGRVDSKKFIKYLENIKIENTEFILKSGLGHRVAIVMRSKNKLSRYVSDNDPHKNGEKVRKITPLNKTEEAKRTARILNKFLIETERRLSGHSKKVNYLLLRGAGIYKKVPSFKERYNMSACCIAGAGLYKGIAKYFGMDIIDVEGATGLPSTNLYKKLKKARDMTDKYDFVFVHIKAADNLGEDGKYIEKKKFIEKIDKSIKILFDSDSLIIITADHSTPCTLKSHSGDPVPIIIYGEGVRSDDVKKFDERSCSKGGIGHINGIDIMKEVLNLTGKAKLVGD